MITLDRSRVAPFLDPHGADAASRATEAAHHKVVGGTGAGADMLGWRSLLLQPNLSLLGKVAEVAAEIRDRADVLLCIGIGGSYLGALAVIDALSPYFGERTGPEVLFAGHHLSPAYHRELFAYLAGKRVYVNVISKSGTTLEPALAFRFARGLVAGMGLEESTSIIATTDARHGVLHDLARSEGYRTFAVPDDVGGRFSVLTPVGLLPIAVSGVDISALVDGASRAAIAATDADVSHPALAYASDRARLHAAGFATELLAVFEPRLRSFGSWWQQLFGESEGKRGRGLFPAVAQYTTDLHSLGQYVQEGPRNLVETFVLADGGEPGPIVEEELGDADQLNYLAGRSMAEVNNLAYEATAAAHAEGGVPNWTFRLGKLDAGTIGEAIYTFEHAVAVSAHLLGVDPFDQPGVEAYKSKMFDLLGRP